MPTTTQTNARKVLTNNAPTPAESKALAVAMVAVPGVAVVPEDETQMGVITDAIMAAYDEFADPQFAADDANEAALGSRERIMIRMAELSEHDGWLAKYTDGACDAALAKWSVGKNRLPTTIAQFKVELRRAIHPSARNHVADAIAESQDVWQAEVDEARIAREADKNAKPERPLLKAFAKRYHMVAGSKGMLQAHIDADTKKNAKVTHDIANDAHALAEAHQSEAAQPSATAAARTIAKLVEAIRVIRSEYPVAELDEMLEIAEGIDADTLKNAKAKADRETQRNADIAKRKAERDARQAAFNGKTPTTKVRNVIDDLTNV